MSLWKSHAAKWGACRACDLCHGRHNVVLARGQLPCDVLFIGEAPGTAEDALGKPFIGPAGKLLDRCIDEAIEEDMVRPRIAFTNLVACIPLGEDGNKTGEPPKSAIAACAPRLMELIKIAQPKSVVRVGKLAEKYFDDTTAERLGIITMVSIVHPAAILRADASRQGLAVQKTVVALNDLFTGY